jgi:glycosyltransferase involved in cell wall biosynthesis
MRLLFVSLIPAYWGGSEVMWSEAAKALARRGHTVSAFFALHREHPALTEVRAAGVRIHSATPPPLRWWRRLAYRARPRTTQFVRLVERLQPEMVIFSQAAVRDGVPEMVECRTRGVRFAVINQLVEPLDYDNETWRGVRAAYSGAEKLWFVSTENREVVANYFGLVLTHADTIPNAYACDFAVPTTWPTRETPTRLAMIGRLYPEQKGHDLLIDALADPRWLERSIEVSVLGDGPAKEALVARCLERGVSTVTFMGHVEQPFWLWASHHALVLPSRYEGQSLAMLEAMLHGRPVITTPVGGTRGLIRDGETGFLASRAEPAAWLDVMERAWQQRGSWRQIGERAAQAVREHVWANPGEKMAGLIEELAQTRPQSRR